MIKMEEKSALRKIIFGIVLSVLGIFMIFYSKTFPKVSSGSSVVTGPGFFPTIIGIFITMFGLYTIVKGILLRKNSLRNRRKCFKSFLKNREFLNFLILILFIAVYPTIINLLGFFIGTFLFCFILMKRLQVKWSSAIVSSIVIVVIAWVIFGKIALIPLPIGIIFTGL